MIGQTLSHFEITGRLGEGGMGTVYRAKDTKLEREVAIKVLPEAFTADAERLARFEREAKVLASLNHPNIAGIYEVGSATPDGNTVHGRKHRGGVPSPPASMAPPPGRAPSPTPTTSGAPIHFLVMELAEGEDLSERLSRGPLPVDQALPIARQIAEALEAAHESGVVHRDLKPANVMLSPDGRVKVLDFGLAKAMGSAGGFVGDLSHSPTLTAQMTGAGVILGTAAYMSPEQAKGEEADKRSDIWSFGILLWEMLVGQKTFNEDTVSETLAAVLKSDPDHGIVPATVPLSVRRLIERCLQKDPKQRLHDIADARLEIEAALRGDESATIVLAEQAEGGKGTKLWRGVAAVASVVGLVAVVSHFLPTGEAPTKDRQPIRFAIDRPPAYIDGRGPGLAISPDGTQVAYWAKNAAGDDQIFLRGLDEVQAVPVPGTEGGVAPFFSPDGSRIGFWSQLEIYSSPIRGGAAAPLIEVQNFRGAVWSDDGKIWYVPDTETGLWRMSSDGSNPERITVPDSEAGERSHRWPAVLPGSDIVLFTVATADIASFDEAHIDALRLSTGERKTVVTGATYPLFLPPHFLLYSVSGTLMAVRFDEGDLSIVGTPTPLVDGLKTIPVSGVAAAAVSADGSLVAGLGQPVVQPRRLVAYDRSGAMEVVTEEIRPYQTVALSPDGTTLALDIDAANAAIWLLDLERDIQTRITTRWSHTHPVWSPDGSELLSSSSSGDSYQIYRHRLAAGQTGILHESRQEQYFATSWSTDDQIAVTVIPIGQGFDLWTLPLEEPARGKPIAASQYTEFGGRFSPDGRWISFVSDESGQPEIYILPATGTGAKIRVSSNGGFFAVWSHGGDELFIHDGVSLLAVSIRGGERLKVGRPQLLFQTGPIFEGSFEAFDVTRDSRFLMIELAEDESESAVDLIFTRYWIDELEEKLGYR